MLSLIKGSFLFVLVWLTPLLAEDRAKWAEFGQSLFEQSTRSNAKAPGYDPVAAREALRMAAAGQFEPWARIMGGGNVPDEAAQMGARVAGLLSRAWIAPELIDPTAEEAEALVADPKVSEPHRTILRTYLYHLSGNEQQAILAFCGQGGGEALQYLVVTGRGAEPLGKALRTLTADVLLGKELPPASLLRYPTRMFKALTILPEGTALSLLRQYVSLANEANQTAVFEAVLKETSQNNEEAILKLRSALLRLLTGSSRPSGKASVVPVERWHKDAIISSGEMTAYREWLLSLAPPALPKDAVQ